MLRKGTSYDQYQQKYNDVDLCFEGIPIIDRDEMSSDESESSHKLDSQEEDSYDFSAEGIDLKDANKEMNFTTAI